MDATPRAGTIFIISAPSGTGKTTLIERLQKTHPEFHYPVTMTTRPMRPGEREGVDYYFVGRDEFERRRAAGDLVEWAVVYDNLYGVPRWELEVPVAAGKDVVFDVDTKGRDTLVARYSGTVSIFIAPPSLEALEARLRNRGANDPRDLARRLGEARAELERAASYDHIVVNDEVGRAYAELVRILEREREGRRGRVARG